jgi:UDP-galactopyranose mutase
VILVVGAGFAGAVMARQLHDAGFSVLVVDKRGHIAGNAYDELNEHGIRFHRYGPHVFNANDVRIVEYLNRFTEWRPYEHRVLAKTRYGLVPVPVNLTTVRLMTGRTLEELREPVENPQTVEDQVVSEVGREIYEELFAGYTEKMWGRPGSELDRSVVGRLRARESEDDRYSLNSFQAMPVDGYTAMFRRLLEGIPVRLALDGRVFDWSDFEHVVWTGPIDEAFEWRFGRLPWRSLEFRHVHYESRDLLQPVGTINYPGWDCAFTRITEWRHLTGQEADWTTQTVEYPLGVGDPYYPVPAPDAQALYRRYERLAKETPKVTFVGRLARYQYLSMHQVVGQALKSARTLATELSTSRYTPCMTPIHKEEDAQAQTRSAQDPEGLRAVRMHQRDAEGGPS